MPIFMRLAAAAAAAALLSTPMQAQQAPPPPAAPLSQQQINEEMLKELKAIHQLLERLTQPQQGTGSQPATASITNLKGYALGRADAPLTMVEFTDLQCPFCRQFVIGTFDQLKRDWIDKGMLRYISRDFPLDFHPQAMPAARAARCAGEQGKFWEMRLGLMRNANLLTPDYITKTAADMKLDTAAFAACATSTKYDAEIQADLAEGSRLPVTGTPTFLMGRTRPDRLEGPVVVGALPYAEFDAKLKDLLDGTIK